MTLLLTYLFFSLLIFANFFIPGFLALQLTKRKLSWDTKLFLSFVIGTLIFLVLSYLFALLQIPQATIVVIELCMLLFLFQKHISLVRQNKHHEHPNFILFIWQDIQAAIKRIGKFRKVITRLDYPLLGIMISGILLFTSLSFGAGLPTQNGIHFWGNESLNHLASIKSHSFFFPPVHPEVTGIPDASLNVFYDFLLSRFVIFYGFSAEDLLFRLFPVYLSCMFGVGVVVITRRYTNNNLLVRIILFVAFAGLLAYTHNLYDQSIVTVSSADQKLYNYYAKEVDIHEFILYLPTPNFHKQPVIAAMTGRNIYLETDNTQKNLVLNERKETLQRLQAALKKCDEQKIHEILREVGTYFIISDKPDSCLASEKIRGTKVVSKTVQFYILKDR